MVFGQKSDFNMFKMFQFSHIGKIAPGQVAMIFNRKELFWN